VCVPESEPQCNQTHLNFTNPKLYQVLVDGEELCPPEAKLRVNLRAEETAAAARLVSEPAGQGQAASSPLAATASPLQAGAAAPQREPAPAQGKVAISPSAVAAPPSPVGEASPSAACREREGDVALKAAQDAPASRQSRAPPKDVAAFEATGGRVTPSVVAPTTDPPELLMLQKMGRARRESEGRGSGEELEEGEMPPDEEEDMELESQDSGQGGQIQQQQQQQQQDPERQPQQPQLHQLMLFPHAAPCSVCIPGGCQCFKTYGADLELVRPAKEVCHQSVSRVGGQLGMTMPLVSSVPRVLVSCALTTPADIDSIVFGPPDPWPQCTIALHHLLVCNSLHGGISAVSY